MKTIPAVGGWIIRYPETEIEIDTGVAPYLEHPDLDASVHYELGEFAFLSASEGVTPRVPVRAMEQYLRFVKTWERS